MRFLFVLKDRPGSFSGPIVNLRRLLPALNEKGHEAELILETHGEHSPHLDHFEAKGVRVHHFILPKGCDQKPYVMEYLKVVKEVAPDLFVPNLSMIGAMAARWVSMAGIPSVVSVRRDEPFNLAFAETFALKGGEWGNCELHCVAEYLKRKCSALADRSVHQKVIPSGCAIPEKARPSYYGEKGAGEKLRIIYSGRVVQPQKRILDLLGILTHIVKKFPDSVEVSILGQGALMERARDLTKKRGVEHGFTFYSKAYGAAYYDILRSHDIQVLFSDFEGLPGSVMDAMGCGLVPVLTCFEGSEELVQHGENGVRLKRRRDLIPLVKELLVNPRMLRQWGERSRSRAIEEFSLERNVRDWREFAETLLRAYPDRGEVPFPEEAEWERLEAPHLPQVQLLKSGWHKFEERLQTRCNLDFPGWFARRYSIP